MVLKCSARIISFMEQIDNQYANKVSYIEWKLSDKKYNIPCIIGKQTQQIMKTTQDNLLESQQSFTPAIQATIKTTEIIGIQKQSQLSMLTQSSQFKIRKLSKKSIKNDSQSSQQDQFQKYKNQQTSSVSMQVINVLDMIQQSQPIDKKVFKTDSLAHDIKLGWVPKTQVTGPIPLSFCHKFIDSVIQSKLNQSKLIYLGPRPTNSFQIHQHYYKQGKNYPFYQFHLCKSQFLERFFKKYYPDYNFYPNLNRGQLIQNTKQLTVQMKENKEQLVFDSDYEGGNLDAVYLEDQEYKLMVRVDSNTRGHCNYYNFKVKCTHPGTYRFRIMNLSKRKLLYERGMKPYIKVINKKAGQQTPWSQCGSTQCQSVRFSPSSLNDISTDQYKQFYSLKFELYLSPSYDYQLCYCIPYTYSQLWHFINSIRDSNNLYVSKLGYSLSGVEVPLLTIADNNNKQNKVKENGQVEEESNLFYVVITGRIHPAESNSSHIVNGLVKFLLKALPQMETIQKHIVFKIIPMLNPDGVIIGNTRTGFAGKDLNRKFSIKTQFIFPEVNNLRDYVMKMKQKYGKKLLFVIDIHGHSTRRGSFFFGPEYSVLDEQYTKCRLLPKLFSLRSEVFRYYSCKFKISQGKEATSRGFFNTNGVRTYTHETSVHSFYDFSTRKDLTFTKKNLQLLGQDLALAIFDYVQKAHLFTTVKQIVEINPLRLYSPKKPYPHHTMPVQPLPQDQQNESDKMPSDKADSESQTDDMEDRKLTVFYQRINQNRQYFYDEIVKMLKNKKQTIASNTTIKKEKKMKLNQIQKHKERKQKDVKIFQRRKSNTNQLGNKVNYTPKRTLFEQYSKTPLNIQKSATQKSPIKISSKLKMGKNEYGQHLRSTSQKISQQFLLGFERVKLQSNTNRIIYSIPSMKWDYDSQHISSRFVERNQIYRYDMNDYPKTELRQKKQKIMNGKYMQNIMFGQVDKKIEPQRKQLKINRQLLEKLLLPASNMIVNEHGRSLVQVVPVKDIKTKVKSSTGGQHFANTDFKVFAAFSEINKSEDINTAQNKNDKLRLQSQVGPQVETKKEEYLCKKWEKEILFKTKRNHSFGGRVQMGETLFGTSQSPFVKTFSKQLSKSPKLPEAQKQANPQTELPKIFLNKKDVLIIN